MSELAMTECPGCGVGPEDECVPGCPATGLERVGWTREQAADILAGRFPRYVEDGSAEPVPGW